jgi:phenylpropionate dioxygenase-like ring-hydroxylating dioxygenase large terminal subunit
MAAGPQPESVLWDDWHAVAEVETLRLNGSITTTLFGRPLVVTETGGHVAVAYADGSHAGDVRTKYELVWVCLGTPHRDIIDLPESLEPDRYVMSVGSLGIRTSGLRLVENFLDLGHFPFVHTGYLGAEPYTEVFPYTVRITDDDEIRLTDCRFEQPQSSAVAEGAAEVQYIFRVLRPYTVVLHKTHPVQRSRWDTVAMTVQPLSEESCVAHVLALTLRDGDPDEACRWFQRLITSQDKPILENQRPARLPLDPRAELPVRADVAATMYRRWLSERGVAYGAIPISESTP